MGLLLFPALLAGAQVKSKSLSAGADWTRQIYRPTGRHECRMSPSPG
jgi:hypothetical protein